MTFTEVRTQFWSGNEDPKTWHPKRRRSVLGRWHEIKLAMWREHLEWCERQAEWERAQKDEVPF